MNDNNETIKKTAERVEKILTWTRTITDCLIGISVTAFMWALLGKWVLNFKSIAIPLTLGVVCMILAIVLTTAFSINLPFANTFNRKLNAEINQLNQKSKATCLNQIEADYDALKKTDCVYIDQALNWMEKPYSYQQIGTWNPDTVIYTENLTGYEAWKKYLGDRELIVVDDKDGREYYFFGKNDLKPIHNLEDKPVINKIWLAVNKNE